MEYKLNQLDKVDAMNCGGTEYKLVSGASRVLQASVYKGTDICQHCDREVMKARVGKLMHLRKHGS